MSSRVDADELGEDLCSLMAELDGRVIEVTGVSGLRAPKHHAAAFRLRFDDGRLMKGRRLRDEATAARVEYVLGTVRHPAFPRLLARRGRALLMEWIEGRGVQSSGSSELRAVADFQASLHAFPVPSDCSSAPQDVIAAQRSRSTRHLQQLADADALGTAEIAALHALLDAHAPSRSEVGFIHGDLCADNAVVDACGEVRIIDNEAVAIGSCDGDLARTLYRWPMAPDECETYLEVYARKRAIEDFIAHFPFWAIAARLGSAAHRIGAPASEAQTPLRGLQTLKCALEREALPLQRVLRSCSLEDTPFD